MTITIERAAAADAGALVEVQVRAFHDDARLYPGVETGGPPGYDSTEVALQKMQQHDYYKILLDGRIVGGMVIFNRENGDHHLDLLYIDPDYHSRGIGTQAMHYLDQIYGSAVWTLDTPAYATRNHHFYEKFGYRKVGEFLEEGTDFRLYSYEKGK